MSDDIWVYPPGRLVWRGKVYACALGRTGVSADKREGDGATPAGAFPIRQVFFRADRIPPPRTALPLRPLSPDDGWCDEPGDERYNRLVKTPYPARHERMWREDHQYDLVAVVGYNDDPPVPGRGSAIFLHIAREGYLPTEGCVALSQPDLAELLGFVPVDVNVRIQSKEQAPAN